jgi:hypothetical protein
MEIGTKIKTRDDNLDEIYPQSDLALTHPPKPSQNNHRQTDGEALAVHQPMEAEERYTWTWLRSDSDRLAATTRTISRP